MVSIDSFSRRLGGFYCLYCLHEIQPFKPKFRIYISLVSFFKPKTIILNLYSFHLAEELGKFRDLVVESKDKGVEIVAAVAKQMLDKNMFIFGAVEETSATMKLNQLTELQNARVRFAYDRLISDTTIEQYIHLDMGKEVNLNSLDKMYVEAKKRATEGAGEIMEMEDIKHISEEKELMGERMEKMKEEWDSQRLSFYEQTKLDGLTTTPKLLKDVEHDEDDGFDELDRLLSQS
ncbi:Small nuclear RNA activating complex (SNAPc) subunit SNAP43 [Arabidopsis suecica]|uniref:Small nuclear RNA activating complex (SNAPc) subunit SNAP43 n=1 Tax=Arabidopsis suecica TaxID=45249 RepID=A0A8T1ZXJ7_ARASU|nr:Small nuclear RNA activating complex (SNAPc) subunit SNAP43 [Arabidopsis suecica]